ncbi:MAG: hypothetical protein E7131_06455 [Rikenellaceae bacterium]|nr:hypothetical protein [Rikenellaceae bacterium]
MRRFITTICLIMLSWSAAAEEGVWQIMQRVSDYMGPQKGYEVRFAIKAEGYNTEGRYCVKGDNYYIEVADAEVYSDGKVRYEVDNLRREVNVDNMDSNSRNIMDNPTRCFDFVEEDYTAEIVKRDANEITLRLQSKDKSVEGEIYLTVNSDSGAPQRVEYLLYDDKMCVEVMAINRAAGNVKSFARSAYKDYEMIDFR